MEKQVETPFLLQSNLAVRISPTKDILSPHFVADVRSASL